MRWFVSRRRNSEGRRPNGGALTLEQSDEVLEYTCPHCGRGYPWVHGFVYEDGDAYVVYHAALYSDHPDDRVALALSFGDWSEEASAENRMRVAIEAWATDDAVNLHVQEPEESPWADSAEFGQMLPRAEALRAPARYFRVAEFVLERDTRLRAHLARRGAG